MTSWRGLLERYLHRRDALRVVCHLVDARHGVTDVDREVSVICDLLCAPLTLFNVEVIFRRSRSISFAVMYVSFFVLSVCLFYCTDDNYRGAGSGGAAVDSD